MPALASGPNSVALEEELPIFGVVAIDHMYLGLRRWLGGRDYGDMREAIKNATRLCAWDGPA